MKKVRTLYLTEHLDEPNPLDCPFIGVPCFLKDNDPGIIYEERWYPGEGENEPSSHLTVLYHGRAINRGITAMCMRNTALDFMPIEPGTGAGREVASYILTGAALKLNLVDETRASIRTSNHQLINTPCLYRGNAALPFGVFKTVWPADNNAGRPEPEKHAVLGFFTVERSMREGFENELLVKWEALKSVLVTPVKFTWPLIGSEKIFVDATVQLELEGTLLAPIMRDTRQSRHAYHLVVSFLAEQIYKVEFPQKPTHAEKKGDLVEAV